MVRFVKAFLFDRDNAWFAGRNVFKCSPDSRSIAEYIYICKKCDPLSHSHNTNICSQTRGVPQNDVTTELCRVTISKFTTNAKQENKPL